MKTILVPTDFSPISKNALAYAVGLAEKFGAKIMLFHAYHTFPVDIDPGLLVKEYHEEIELFKKVSDVQLKALCEEIGNTSTCKCDYISLQGLAKDVIIEYANDTNPDLLVIGTENLLPMERIIYGTITGRVIKDVDCTLLVVPERAKFTTPKKIAFAIDYHDSDLKEIQFVEKLANKFNAKTHIVHIITELENEDFEVTYFTKTINEIKLNIPKNNTIFKLINGENITEELEEYVKEEDIDILAVAKTKKSFMERLFSKDTTQQLFYHTKMPLLIFEAEDGPEDFI